MAAVQMMCARGKVTGQGLAANFRQRFPSWLLGVVIVALLAANTINIAADLAGMADAAEMLSGVIAYFRGGFRTPDFVGNDPASLSPDRERAQVAGTGAVRLPDNRVCGGGGLGRSGSRDLHTVAATHQI